LAKARPICHHSCSLVASHSLAAWHWLPASRWPAAVKRLAEMHQQAVSLWLAVAGLRVRWRAVSYHSPSYHIAQWQSTAMAAETCPARTRQPERPLRSRRTGRYGQKWIGPAYLGQLCFALVAAVIIMCVAP
jgi:hypothetical protein